MCVLTGIQDNSMIDEKWIEELYVHAILLYSYTHYSIADIHSNTTVSLTYVFPIMASPSVRVDQHYNYRLQKYAHSTPVHSITSSCTTTCTRNPNTSVICSRGSSGKVRLLDVHIGCIFYNLLSCSAGVLFVEGDQHKQQVRALIRMHRPTMLTNRSCLHLSSVESW